MRRDLLRHASKGRPPAKSLSAFSDLLRLCSVNPLILRRRAFRVSPSRGPVSRGSRHSHKQHRALAKQPRQLYPSRSSSNRFCPELPLRTKIPGPDFPPGWPPGLANSRFPPGVGSPPGGGTMGNGSWVRSSFDARACAARHNDDDVRPFSRTAPAANSLKRSNAGPPHTRLFAMTSSVCPPHVAALPSDTFK